MKLKLRIYAVYSIGCAVVSALLLAVVAAGKGKRDMRNMLLVFYGWVIVWVSNRTLARLSRHPR